MPARRSNAALLLQKVNTQLHGERVPLKSKDEDELAAYLNSLTLKAQQVRQIQEYEDNSTSSGADSKTSGSIVGLRSISPAVPAPASRFLKKKPTPDVAAHTGSANTHDVASKKTESKAILSGLNKKAPHQARSANEVEASIQSGKVSGRHQLVSRDSQSEISIQGPDVGQRPDSAEYVGRDASKVLKSNNFQDHDRNTASRFPIAQPVSKEKDEIARTLGSHFVPSDQDSLTEFIQGLSTSELSARRPQNLVTKKQQKWRKRASSSASHSPSPVLESRPQSPFRRSKSPFGKLSLSASQDSDMVDSMASEILDDRPGSSNSEQHFKINLMDVASLLPSSPSPPPPLPRIQKKIEDTHFNSQTQKHKSLSDNVRSSPTNIVKLHKKQKPVSLRSPPKKTESSSSLLDALGIRMADELLSVGTDGDRAVQLDISEESEIRTQSSHEHKKMLERQRSESSIVTDIGDERKKASSAKRNSFVTKARQISKNVDVTDVDVTDVDEYSDSFNSESSARTASISQRSRDNKSRTLSTKKESNRHKDHKLVMEEMLVDVSTTDAKGATRRWNTTHTDIHVSGPYGLQYVDPAPVATHIVSADALEAVTAYSPNMLALHEMMKVQLELVQNFVGIQQRIYQSCMDGLQYDYKYTTLEDTREYIRKNQKPRLTLKEALQLVEQEETITA